MPGTTSASPCTTSPQSVRRTTPTGAVVVEPDRERHVVGGTGSPPPPLHVGCVPDPDQRVDRTRALEHGRRRPHAVDARGVIDAHDVTIGQHLLESPRERSRTRSRESCSAGRTVCVPSARRERSVRAGQPTLPTRDNRAIGNGSLAGCRWDGTRIGVSETNREQLAVVESTGANADVVPCSCARIGAEALTAP